MMGENRTSVLKGSLPVPGKAIAFQSRFSVFQTRLVGLYRVLGPFL